MRSKSLTTSEPNPSYASSKLLINIIRELSIPQRILQYSFDKCINSLPYFTESERSVFFELIGASLQTFSVGDKVRYHPKRNNIYKYAAPEDYSMEIVSDEFPFHE